MNTYNLIIFSRLQCTGSAFCNHDWSHCFKRIVKGQLFPMTATIVNALMRQLFHFISIPSRSSLILILCRFSPRMRMIREHSFPCLKMESSGIIGIFSEYSSQHSWQTTKLSIRYQPDSLLLANMIVCQVQMILNTIQ